MTQKKTEKLNKAVKSTNGKKTYVIAACMLLLSLFEGKIPFLQENKETIRQILEGLLASGVLHKVWRNKDELSEWFKKLFKKSNNQ